MPAAARGARRGGRVPGHRGPGGPGQGLPVGLSFPGPAWSEPALTGLAYAFEQASLKTSPQATLPAGGRPQR